MDLNRAKRFSGSKGEKMGRGNFGRHKCNFRRQSFPLKGCIKDSILSCVNQF